MSIEIENAFKVLSKAIAEDLDYAWSWQCNLAMMAYDAGATHEAANRSAAGLMYTLFGVKMWDTKYYQDFVKQWAEGNYKA